MNIGNAHRRGVKGQAVAHHEITPGILLLFIKIGKADLTALTHFFKIRAKGLGADEQRADVFLFKRFFTLAQGHLIP